MTRWSFSRIAGALYLIAVGMLCIRAGEPGDPQWWLMAVPMAAWIASPVVGGLFLGRRFRSGPARILFASLLAVIAVLGFALQWYTMFIGPSDAQNALVLVFVPLYQWVGVVSGLALAWLLARARGTNR